jgi:hypothetical protein
METAPAAPSAPSPARVAAWAAGLLLAGLIAFALWPQEFRFERQTPVGRERVAVYSRWGFIVKEAVLEAEGTPARNRTFPVGQVGLWRIGALAEIPGDWEPSAPP